MAVLDQPVNGKVNEHRSPTLIRMIRALRDDAISLGRNAVFLGVGGVISLFGIFFLLLALNNLLFAGLARAGFTGSTASWLAPILTGMGILIVALALVLKSLRGMRRSAPIPDRTLETLRDDKEWMKGKFR